MSRPCQIAHSEDSPVALDAESMAPAVSEFHVNENSQVYYQGIYWNDYELVRHHLNARFSGDELQTWSDRFSEITRRKFQRALVLNCGNGWVERELVRTGLFAEAVGIDYSEQLLAEARACAREDGLPLSYERHDINSGTLPAGPFDLVINHAAAHHIARIDRVFRAICRVLPEDGWFVSFDYVGPHRNQYRAEAWEEAWAVNQGLPNSLRQDMRYPSIPTMLIIDPTEAIHSELILDTFRRYFVVEELTPLGGAIAYPLLTHNRAMFEETDSGAQARWIQWVLEADDRFLEVHPNSSLFAYFAGRPNKAVLRREHQLAQWENEESARERRAQENGGEYYARGAFVTALLELEAARREIEEATGRVSALESEISTMESSPLYSGVRRLLDARLTRRIRQNRAAAALERRARALMKQGLG